MSVVLYGATPRHFAQKELHWLNDTIKVALLTSSYSPDQDSDDYWNDVSSFQASGTGYTAGGATLSGKSQSYNASNNVRTFDANDVEWTSSTITARWAVIYSDTPSSASEKPLIAYVDFGSERSSSEGTFRIAWNAAGIIDVTIS